MTLACCENLGCRFADRWVLADIDLMAGAGEIIGVVGPNGAGKTTLLRILAGDILAHRGRVAIAGQPSGTRIARSLVGYAGDPPLAPPELTGIEWLRYLASHSAHSPRERVDVVRAAIEVGDIGDFAGRRIGEYSRGMAQRLGLAAATVSGRKVVLLDETLSGMDSLVVRGLRLALARLASGGRLVMLASHDLASIEDVATRVLVLSRGRLAGDIGMATLLRERVFELSLNGGALASPEWILHRFRGALRTGAGISVPLVDGLSPEQVLEECRIQRVAVASSRVRYRRLEDILVASAAGRVP